VQDANKLAVYLVRNVVQGERTDRGTYGPPRGAGVAMLRACADLAMGPA
jgi:hypothetical protein